MHKNIPGHFHENVSSTDISGLSIWGVRLVMARNGWESSVEVGGPYWGDGSGASVRFSRWDWHGRFVGGRQVSFGKSVKNPTIDQIGQLVRGVAEIALHAWHDFPDEVPCQGIGGIVSDTSRNRLLAMYQPFVQENYSESIPVPEELCDLREEKEYLLRLQMLEENIWTRDSLTYVGWTLDRQKQDRTWGWTLRATPEKWLGQDVMPFDFDFSTQYLIESIIYDLVNQARTTITRLHDRGVMPAGMETIEGSIVEEELRKREAEDKIFSETEGEPSTLLQRVRRIRWESNWVLQKYLPKP